MPTTTIRLPDELKARVARAAERIGTSAHNFIIEAIAEKTDAQDRQFEFQQIAHQRLVKYAATGESIPWPDMRAWLERSVADAPTQKPLPKKRRYS